MYVEITQNTVETPLMDTACGWEHPSLDDTLQQENSFDGQLRVKSTAFQIMLWLNLHSAWLCEKYSDFSLILQFNNVFSQPFQPCF